MNKTDLTIVMPTWNKEAYIRDALDSIFAQKTRFSYHIIVADDHSTDGTLDIVHEYEQQHSGVFTVLASEKNQKLYKNVIRAYAITKTPYFCVLDPDDYWVRDGFLEEALTFLESHSDFTIYTAGIEMLHPDGSRKRCAFPLGERTSTFEDYLRGRAVISYTPSSVYRNVVFANGLPDKMVNLESPTNERTFRADSFRNFIHIREGKAHYSPEVVSCYRLTGEGIYAGSSEVSRQLLNARIFADLWQYDDRRHIELLQSSRSYFNRVKDVLLKGWDKEDLSSGKCLAEIKEFVSLGNLYMDNSVELNRCLSKRLSLLKKICLWAALKLQKKGII